MYTKHEIVYAKHEISEIKHEIGYTKHEIIIIIIIIIIKVNRYLLINNNSFYHCTVHPKIYAVHIPTYTLLIELGKVLKFTLKYTIISLLHVSVYDHHEGARTVPG